MSDCVADADSHWCRISKRFTSIGRLKSGGKADVAAHRRGHERKSASLTADPPQYQNEMVVDHAMCSSVAASSKNDRAA
jgi:hypothetical protein